MNDSNAFIEWCECFAFVEDKLTHRSIPFKLYDCQRQVARKLAGGEWLWILKARRLGLTWLLAAYTAWLLAEKENRIVIVLNQTKDYAQEFIERVRSIVDLLPEDRKPKFVKDSKALLATEDNCSVRSLACTKRSIRSMSADLVIFDEAAYMELLKHARKAAQPAVETGKGQVVAISTSNGPSGEFYDIWQDSAAGRTRYTPVFLDWRQLPRRNDDWYEREKRENESDPLYMKREYPSSAEEAFESAEGRIYPLFIRTDKFIHAREIHPDWKKYRAIDFGGVDPFVCLWGAVIPGDGPGLTVDPVCKELVRELLAYSYDSSGAPQERENHCCDALRYMVVTAPITGHLHIYREFVLRNSVALGYDLPALAERIKFFTKDEAIKSTVADRSRPDSIKLLVKKWFPTIGAKQLCNNQVGEVIEGLCRVNELIVGTHKQRPPEPDHAEKFAGLPEAIRRRGIF